MTRRTFVTAATAAAGAAAPPGPFAPWAFPPIASASAGLRRGIPSPISSMRISAARGGVQAYLSSLRAGVPEETAAAERRAGDVREFTTPLPKDDTDAFERTVKAAKETGVACMRSVCLSGRRYENFSSLDEWKAFVTESHAKLGKTVKILEKHRMPLALENHKDWTVDQMVPLLKQYSSEYLGACIDWGNNISLLDDPVEVIERLAPFAIASHIKDMAVEEYADGFYLAEVPLGQGMLPLKKLLDVVQAARPKSKFSLDMLTRNPLLVPCLTPKYWVTFGDRNGKYLANALRAVRANKPKKPLVRLDAMDQAAKVQLEQENIRQCVAFARDGLGLKA